MSWGVIYRSIWVGSIGVAPKLLCELNSFCLFPSCHRAKQSSFPTASPLAWLTAVCQPSSLVSTSVNTPLFFHCRMFSSFLPLSTSVSFPYLPSLRPLWWYMLLSPWNTGFEPKKPSLLTATSSVLGTLLDNSSTSVYRPIGALVCKPPKGSGCPVG